DAFPGAVTGGGEGARRAGLQQLAVLEVGGQARKRVPGEGKQGSGRAVADRDADPPRTGEAVRVLIGGCAAVEPEPHGEGKQDGQEDAREHAPVAHRFSTVLWLAEFHLVPPHLVWADAVVRVWICSTRAQSTDSLQEQR